MLSNWRLPVVAALFLAAILVPASVTFYTDWLWFGETGYRSVFLRSLTAQGLVGVTALVLALAVLLVNIRVALRALAPRELVIMTREGPIGLTVDRRRIQPLVTAGALVISVFFGLYATSQWDEWLFFRYAQPFGQVDPILGRDAGFYVFQLPFLEALRGFLFTLLALTVAVTAGLYVVAGSATVDVQRGLWLSASARRHLAALVAGLFLILAFGAYLDVFGLLTSPSGIVFGISNVDAVVGVPALRVLMVAALAGAGLALYQGVNRAWWPILTAVGLYVVVSVAGSVAGGVMQRLIIAPNEQVRETPYIEHNIAATRVAFGLDNVEDRELSGDAVLSRADIDANEATLGNVRLWDHQPLLQTFAQIQEIRTY